MATGAGKTFTAITSSYRLLKHAGAKRILFLVDTRNLGEQAEQEGQLKFTEEQMEWLCMIKDHIAASVMIEKDDLEYAPFNAKGGLGWFYELFQTDTDQILQDINDALTA